MRKYLEADRRLHGKPHDLITDPVVILLKDFNEEGYAEFKDAMNKGHETGQPVIPVVVDSFGGAVYSLLGMIHCMREAKVPVATVVESKATSAGAVLFAMGTPGYRFVAPHATLMIHEVSHFTWGKVEQLAANTAHTKYLNRKLFTLMAKNCGHPQDYFLKMIDQKRHADWYLTAKDAKKHKIADHIRTPELKTEITVTMSFR